MYRLLFVLVVVAVVGDAKRLASYIKPCKRDDPDLNACAKRNGLEAIPYLLKGDREYKNPPLSPLLLPRLDIVSGGLQIHFKDLVLSGLEKVDFREMRINLPEKRIGVVVAFPAVNIQSQYEMEGRLLVVPLNGKGPANLTFYDVVVDYTFTYDLIKKKDGKEYIDPAIKPNVKYTLGGAHYHFDNLFNGETKLGEQTNKFLNEHSAEVNEDLGDSISQTISAVVTNIIQLVLAVVPFDELFI